MADYGFVVDDLLNTTNKETKNDFGFVVDDLFGAKQVPKPLPIGVANTGRVSTITNKPVLEYDEKSPDQASLLTLTKAELVKSPSAKMKIYAESRGVPVDRYSLDKDGEIIFKDDSGRLRYEEKSQVPTDKIKQIGANILGNPSISLSTIGAAVGPEGAVTGAIAGESIRQVIAGLVFDDPQTAKGNLIDLGTEGILGALSEFGGRGVMKGFNRILGIGKPEGRMLADAAKRDFPHIQADEVNKVYQLGQDFGIDLFPPQTTKSKQLIAKMNLLRDLPQTSDIIQAADKLQNEQIQGAIPEFLNRIAPSGNTSRDVGEQIAKLSNEALQGIKDERSKIAGPIYKKAFEENPVIDTRNALDFIDSNLEYARGAEKDALISLRKDLTEPEPSLFKTGPDGKQIPPEENEATLRSLHGMKTYLDKRINSVGKPGAASFDNLIVGEMKQIKGMLVDAMDEASPNYKLARATYALMSPDVEKATKGLTGIIANTNEKDLSNLSSLIMSSKYTKPETIAAVKGEILKQKNGEEVWNSAVRDYLEFTFENIKDSSITGASNIGGTFRKSVFGNVQQRKILAEALGPDKYSQLNDFMTVLERTGLTFKGESTTAIRQQALEDMKEEFGSTAVSSLTQPLQAPRRILGDKINDILFARGTEKLANALINNDAAQQLLALKKMPKGSEELIKGLTQFLELTGIEEIKDEVK